MEDTPDMIMNGLLALFFLVVLFSLWRAHRENGTSKYKNFNVLDLIMTRDGYIDRPAFSETTVLVIMTWGFITLIVQKGMTEWYAGLYCSIFVLRAGWSAYLKSKGIDAGTKDSSAPR